MADEKARGFELNGRKHYPCSSLRNLLSHQKSCLLIWVLLTTQYGRCEDTPPAAQQVVSTLDTQEESVSSRGARSAPLPHYGHGSPGHHHGFQGLVGILHGLGGHTGSEPIHGRGLGDIYGNLFHGGLFGRHGMRQASDDNAFNPRDRLPFYGSPERNRISGTIPAFETLPVSQKYGTPLVPANGLYEPQLRWHDISSSYPPARLWLYPARGTGVGLGVDHGAGTSEQYSKGSSGHHTGWMPAFHEQHNVHGMAGLGKTGSPERATTGHAMETQKNITRMHGSSSPGYGHRTLNDAYHGLDNDHSFGLHKDMHTGGTGKYLGASQYHGNGYYGMAAYHPEAGYHAGGYHTQGHHGDIVRSHKANGAEEVSTHDAASGKSKPSVYKTGMPVAGYPPVLSNGGRSATHYARGLHVDLLHGSTATLDAENSDHMPDKLSLTGGQAALAGAQNGIPAKHVPGGTHLTESGNGNQGSSKTQQYLVGLIPNTLVGLQGHQFNENTDRQLWTAYDSHKYDYHGGDIGYGVVLSTYLPWYNQHYITPHPSVQTHYGHSLRQSAACVTPCKNLGLGGELQVGLS